MKIGDMDTLISGLYKFFEDNDDVELSADVPLSICRYNSEQVIDRIVIQVRGGYGVTIHTADAGQGDR